MLNEEELMNLSQYKYLYKIYIANNTFNIEKLKLIYINKKQCVFLEGDIVKISGNKNLFSEYNIDKAIEEAYDWFLSRKWTEQFLIISKNKLNIDKFEIRKDIKIKLIKNQIKDNKLKIVRINNSINFYNKDINSIQNKINDLEKELEELDKE